MGTGGEIGGVLNLSITLDMVPNLMRGAPLIIVKVLAKVG